MRRGRYVGGQEEGETRVATRMPALRVPVCVFLPSVYKMQNNIA